VEAIGEAIEEVVGDELADNDVGALIFKWYILSLSGPPQYSSEFPSQSILHPEAVKTLPGFKVLPQ